MQQLTSRELNGTFQEAYYEDANLGRASSDHETNTHYALQWYAERVVNLTAVSMSSGLQLFTK